MLNEILDFEKNLEEGYESDFYIISDFTNDFWKNIPEKYYTDSKYFKWYKVSDNELIDYISFKEYDVVKYWDLLCIINNIHSTLELPKDNNTILEKANILYERWYSLHGYGKPKWFCENKKKYYENIVFKENEKFRNIKVIRREYLSELQYDILDVVKQDYKDSNISNYTDTLINQ
jgi:hypothetical protein